MALYRLDFFRRYPGLRSVGAEAEIIGTSHDKIRAGLVFQIPFHAESAGEQKDNGQKHHGKGQRYHNQHGFLLIPSQIGQRHPPDACVLSLSFSFGGKRRFGIFHRLHRRDFRRHPARFFTGEQHCNHGKESRHKKNQRRTADTGADFPQTGSLDHQRHQQISHQPSGCKPHRAADSAQQKRLLADDPLQLTGRHTDGL